MKKTFKISTLLNTLLLLMVASCLPVQKETQCGNNEAFNATRRKCVPVIGSASTNTVFIKSKAPENSYTMTLGDNPIEHSVAVSDVYNYGFSTKWNLRFTSSVNSIYNFSTDAVQTNTLSYNFLPPTTSTPELAGSYTVECIVLDQDASVQLDSVSWTVQVGALATPQFTNPSPALTFLTYPSNSNSEVLSIEIDNPDSQVGIYTWYVNSVAVSGPTAFTSSPNPFPLSYTIDPENDLGSGIHNIEVRITQLTDPSIVFDSYVWGVSVVDPDLPVIASGSPAFSDTILNIDGVDYSSQGYLNSTFDTLNSLTNPGLCVTVDDYDKDGDLISDLDYSLDINGNYLVSSADLGSDTVCITSALTANNLVSSQVGESKTITFSTYLKGTSTLVEQRQWALTVIPKNSTPKISIRLNGSHTLSCSGLSDDALSATNCTATQSVDITESLSYTDETVVGEEDVDNTFQVSINVKDLETYSQANPSDTYGEDNMEIVFQVQKQGDAGFQDLDTTSIYSISDCYSAPGDIKVGGQPAQGSSPTSGYDENYVCNVGINAFNLSTNTPLESGTYKLKAFVRDAGSSFAPGNIQESNQVTWNIEVAETTSTAEIQAQATAASTTESYVEISNSACTLSGPVLDTVTPSVSENDFIKVHTIVRDKERDNLYITLKMSNAVSGGESTVVPLSVVTSTYDDDGYVDIESCFEIPEWVVDGSLGTSASANIIAEITELDDDNNQTTPPTGTFTIAVNNNNPVPQFADSSDVALSPSDSVLTPGSDIIVHAGFPFEIDPPLYTDASVIDGDNVSWQWQICYGDTADCPVNGDYAGATDPNANWVNISNANDTGNSISENLVWTPNPLIAANTNINLRICLGDDGGNPNDCSSASSGTYAGSFKVYQNIKVYPSQINETAYSENELATWFDETNDVLYTAQTSGTNIIVSKTERSSVAGEKQLEQIHEISFPTEEPNKTSDVATQLSMSGIDGTSVYIAYKVNDQVTSAPQARVRRIDISNDTFSFNYGGLYNNDTNDMVDVAPVDPSTTLGSTGNADLIVTFSPPVAADSITFRMADGDLITVNYCAGTCASAAIAAGDLETALLAESELLKEFTVSNSGSSVTVNGPPKDDFADFGGISVNIGQIVVDTTNDRWYVPYAATSSLNLYYGGNASLDMTNFVASTQSVAGAGSVNQEVASAIDSNNRVIIATKNSSGNLSVYRIDSSFALVDNVSNVFNFTGSEEIEGISVSSGGADDDVYIACKNINAATGFISLSAAVLDGNGITSYGSTTTFNSTNYLAQPGIDEVKIIGHPTSDGQAIIAVTTNQDHQEDVGSSPGDGIPNEAHLFKIFMADTLTFTGAPVLASYNSSATNLTSPKLNTNPTVDLGAISVTPIFTYTVGHTDDSSIPATEDAAKASLFFSFFENNGSNELVQGMYNIESETISTDSTDTTGSYPSTIEN